jgi:structural maintenance of chromosome 1
VTDLAKVTQRKYNLALAVVMGRELDSVVVDNQRTAQDCMQLLKDQKIGVMTFFPIESVKVGGCWCRCSTRAGHWI